MGAQSQRRESNPLHLSTKQAGHHDRWRHLERVGRVERPCPGWKPGLLPLEDTRMALTTGIEPASTHADNVPAIQLPPSRLGAATGTRTQILRLATERPTLG